MNNRRTFAAAIILFFITTVSVLAFQNCGGSTSAGGSMGLGSTGPAYAQNEIIVRMKDAASDSDLRTWATSNGLTLKNQWPSMYATHWTWPGTTTVQQLQDTLAGSSLSSGMVYSEPNFYFQKQDMGGPNQTLSWGDIQTLSTTTTMTQTSAPINESAVWSELPASGAKPIVAVIDTGIDLTHVAFTGSGAIWTNTAEVAGNGIDDDGNGYVDDVHGWNFADNNNNVQDTEGHGTHCAGIVLGVGQNIFANPPSAAKIQIMPLKFIGPSGGLTSDAINAIIYAVNNGAKVMSNSWGGPSVSKALEDAISYAYDHDVIFVAAAGNNATNNDITPQYPAAYTVPNVLTVAATDATDNLASFSNFGSMSVHAGAPGVSILSTYIPNSFAYLSGTSMATPFIAGTAIYMKYSRPQMGGYQTKNVILSNLDSDTSLSGRTIVPGRLDPAKAVSASMTVAIDGTHPAFVSKLSASAGQSSGGAKAGCGLVAPVSSKDDFPKGPGAGTLLLFVLPIAFWLVLARISRNGSEAS